MKKNYFLWLLAILILLIVIWRVYAMLNVKRMGPADGRAEMQNFQESDHMKRNKE